MSLLPSDLPVSAAPPPPEEPTPLAQSTVWLMAVTVAVVVANIYYIQPLLGDIAQAFGLTVTRAGSLAMLSQAGTACGMLFFVPLGDKYERRALILFLLVGDVASLLLVALAPNILVLSIAAFLVGAFSANVHVVVPFAAHLAAPSQRGRVVGTIVGGILIGVLLARTFSGTVGAWLGWRAVYAIAAAAMLLIAVVVRAGLPTSRPEVAMTWSHLMKSTWALSRRHALLRESAFLGALLFAAFSAFWTTLVFLLAAPPYSFHTPSATAGLFGLVGALGALVAPSVGHLADKHGPRFTIRIALWLTLVSFLLLGASGKYLPGLVLGVILMDLGVQSGHVSNQTRIYGIDPAARSRLNTVYMFCYFIGGGLGSLSGALCWHWLGWWGVCLVGCTALATALLVESSTPRTRVDRNRAIHEQPTPSSMIFLIAESANLIGGDMFMILLILLIAAALGFKVWMIADCLNYETKEGNKKLMWLLIVCLVPFGSLIYFFVRKLSRSSSPPPVP